MDIISEELVNFCRALIRTPSLAAREKDVAALARDEMVRLGFDEVELDEFGSAVGILRNGTGPTVVFDAHLDTVGVDPIADWSFDPFGGWEEDGKIYGRGAMDMKGPAAAMAHGLASLAHEKREFRGTIVCSLSTLEEISEGVALANVIEQHGCDMLVIAEATNLSLVRGQRGRAEFALTTHGVATHSSTPHFGVDAVEKMMDLIARIKAMPMPNHPLLGEGVQALTDIISTPYPAMSTVPFQCRATFDRRLLLGETEESVLAEINDVIAAAQAEDESMKAEAEIVTAEYKAYTSEEYTFRKFLPAWVMEDDHPIVRSAHGALREAAVGSGEIGHYRFCTNGSLPEKHFGLPTIGFGPGDEDLAHRKDEWIAIDDLVAAATGYAAIAKTLTALDI